MSVINDTIVSPGFKTSSGTTLTWNHTVSAGLVNGLLTVQLDSGAGSVPTTTSVQWDALGTPASLIKQTNRPTDGSVTTEHWGLLAPSSGTKQVKITMPSAVEITGGSASWQYVDQSTTCGFRNAGDNTTGGTSTSASITANTANGDVVLFSAYADDGGASDTLVNSVGTLIHQQSVGANKHDGASAYVSATGATQAVSFTGVTNGYAWGILASSIKWDGVNPSASGRSPNRTIQGSIPGAFRARAPISAPVIFGRPAIRGSLVSGLPRKIIKAGLPLAMWAGWTGWPAVYGKADLERPAIRGALVTGAPRHIIKPAGVPLNAFALAAWPTVYGTADLYRPAIRGQLVAGPPRKTLTARSPIVRPWAGGASILHPKLGVGAIITGAPRRTILAAIPRQRPWAGGATIASPAIGLVAQPAGAPRHTTLAALAIKRPWFGGASVTVPSIRGSLVTGAPRGVHVVSTPIVRSTPIGARVLGVRLGTAPVVGVPRHVVIWGRSAITLRWPQTTILVRPAIRGPLVTGYPRRIVAAGVPILRARPDLRAAPQCFGPRIGSVFTNVPTVRPRALFVPDSIEATFAPDAVAASFAADAIETTFIPDVL